jgi:WD40 repeat protein
MTCAGNYVCSGGEDALMYVWEKETMEPIHAFHGHLGSVNSLATLTSQVRLWTSAVACCLSPSNFILSMRSCLGSAVLTPCSHTPPLLPT